MTRKAKFGDTVIGWGCKYRHAVLKHEYVIVAPTRTALIAILNAGTEPLQVWRKNWLRRAQVVKPKTVEDANLANKKPPSVPARVRK